MVDAERRDGDFLADCWAATPKASSSGCKVLLLLQRVVDITRYFIDLFSSRSEKIWMSWENSTNTKELLSAGKIGSYIRKLIIIFLLRYSIPALLY